MVCVCVCVCVCVWRACVRHCVVCRGGGGGGEVRVFIKQKKVFWWSLPSSKHWITTYFILSLLPVLPLSHSLTPHPHPSPFSPSSSPTPAMSLVCVSTFYFQLSKWLNVCPTYFTAEKRCLVFLASVPGRHFPGQCSWPAFSWVDLSQAGHLVCSGASSTRHVLKGT